MAITFDQPLLLGLLLPSLAFVWYLWQTSRVYLPPVRRHLSLVLRMFSVTLLVAVLAGPNVRLNASDLSEAILIDRSESITPAQRAQEEAFVADVLSRKSANDRIAAVSFAGTASVERPLSSDSTRPIYSEDSTLDVSRTDIGGAIQLGVGLLPPDSARRLILISDGNSNTGDAQQAATLARSAGIQLDTVALSGESGPQALVEALDAPTRLHEGDSFTATVQARATQPMQGTLQLLADDQVVGSQDVQLHPGANRFILPVDGLKVGTHVLSVVMQTDGDPRPENKTGGAYVIVDGPPEVLIVEGTPGEGQYLAQALQAAGLQVDVAKPSDGPFQADTLNNYASVVLANVPADQLTPEGTDALKTYVQTHGGGLVVAGGSQAYGAGQYARAPLEDILPVSADLHGSSVQAGVGLVLAIDTSGSMGADVGGTTIMDLAKEAAIAAAENLGPGDEIGVISMQDKSTWAIEPTPASNSDAISTAINQMSPGGGDDTNANGISMAYQALAGVDVGNKHILLITDGENPGGNYQPVMQQVRAASMTVSTIGIGEQSDTQLLQETAALGGGAYYDGSDPFNLPQLVLKETQQLQRAAIVEQSTQPMPIGSSPALAGIDTRQLPPLRGYVATTPKPQGSVLLASPTGDPLLAEWQYGLGRAISWTSDVSNRWSADWISQGQSFETFWAQVVKQTIRPPEDANRQVSVSLSGDQAKISLDALNGAEGTPDRQYVNFLPTSVSVVDPAGKVQQVQLPQVAPGQYQATLPATTQGVYTLQVAENEPDGSNSTQASGFVVPYSPEYRDLTTNTDALAALASITGGQSIQSVDAALQHDLPSVGAPRPLWPWLLAFAALILVADIGVRRVRFSAFEMRVGYQAMRSRLGHTDNRPTRVAARRVPVIHATPLISSSPSTVQSPAPVTSMSQQLLAAKRRAAKR